MSTSPRNPTRFRRRSPCSPNAASPTAPSHARGAALPKKHVEVVAEANIALIVQSKDNNQPTLHQQIQESPQPRRPSGQPLAAERAATATNPAPSASSIPPTNWPTPTGTHTSLP